MQWGGHKEDSEHGELHGSEEGVSPPRKQRERSSRERNLQAQRLKRTTACDYQTSLLREGPGKHTWSPCGPLRSGHPGLTGTTLLMLLHDVTFICSWSLFHFCKLHEEQGPFLWFPQCSNFSTQNKGWQTLWEGQIINISDFAGHVDFPTTTELLL